MDKFQQKLKSGAQKASAFTPSAVFVAATAAAAFSAPYDAYAAAAKATAQPAAAPVCVGEMAPSVTMRVAEGKSGTLDLTQLNLPAPAWLRAVGNPEIVQMEPLTSATPRNMFFAFGKKVGATNLMFQSREGRCGLVEINVGIDTAAVRSSLNELMPAETGIKVSSAANSLVISGTASDAGAVERIMTIAGAFVRKQDGSADSAQDRVVNMMSIGSPQQVMLEVKVAEISRSVLDKFGGNLSLGSSRGSWTSTLLSNFSAGAAGAFGLQKGNDSLQIDADVKNGLVKILAEPTVMAVSGQDGSFLAGGRIFIPVAQDANGKVTLEEKEFGVGLQFTPTVLEGGRINLKVAPEVSELSREGVGFTSASGGNAILPLITTRRAATTVQLYDGQSFAIGGLIKNNVTENIKAVPGLGEIPVLGALFRSTDFQNDKTELVFIVTPRLVKPLPASYPLPTDSFVPPSRQELFLEGSMEAKPKTPAQPGEADKPAAAPSASLTGFELK